MRLRIVAARKLSPVQKALKAPNEVVVLTGRELGQTYLFKDPTWHDLKYLRGSQLRDEPHISVIRDRIVMADVELQANPYRDDTWWFMHIVVRPEALGQGLASILMKRVFEYIQASDRHVLKMSSFSADGLQKIRPLCERLKAEYPDILVVYDEDRENHYKYGSPK